MSQAPRFESFEEFWPFYVREHSDPTNRKLHFTGTALALATVGYAVLKRKPKALLVAPLFGYGFAWVGHFLVEKNRPATFAHPLWSLRGDFKMFANMLAGTMDEEVRRVMESEAPKAPSATDAGAAEASASTTTDGAPAARPASPRASSSGRLN